AAAQLVAARAHDLVDLSQPEGHEEQPRLVDVAVVAVDDVDLGLVLAVAAAEPVGGHRPAGASAQDQDSLLHGRSVAGAAWPSAHPRNVLRTTTWLSSCPHPDQRRRGW